MLGRVFQLGICCFLAIACFFLACKKSSPVTENQPSPEPKIPEPKTIAVPKCEYFPSYGDTVLSGEFSETNDYIVQPLQNPGNGTFVASPVGLVIDAFSGAINVSKSEAGLKYAVGFVKTGTSDTCYTNISVAGINYVDSIYVISKHDTLAKPVYDAIPTLPPFCDYSDDTDYPPSGGGQGNGNGKCRFDVKVKLDDENVDDDNNDDDKYYTANKYKLRVRTKSGIINLKKSLSAGLFGRTPKNGDSKELDIYYELNDKSKNSLRKITVKVMYFNKKADIPAALSAEISSKRNDFLNGKVIRHGKPRPPLIVITRDLL